MKKQSRLRQTFDLHKIQLSISTLIFILLLISCNSRSENRDHSSNSHNDSLGLDDTQNSSRDSIVSFLLDAAAIDFHEHQPPVPLDFRNIQFKYLTKPNGEKTYIICGQFLTKGNQLNDEWIHFATIKTDPYEQWMGSNALMYCQDSKEITYTKTDLSIALKSRYDSKKNGVN